MSNLYIDRMVILGFTLFGFVSYVTDTVLFSVCVAKK